MGPWVRGDAQAAEPEGGLDLGASFRGHAPSVSPPVAYALTGIELSWPFPFLTSHDHGRSGPQFRYLQDGTGAPTRQDVVNGSKEFTRSDRRYWVVNECLSLGFTYKLFLILAPNTSSLQPPAAWSRGKGSDGLGGWGEASFPGPEFSPGCCPSTHASGRPERPREAGVIIRQRQRAGPVPGSTRDLRS